MKLLIERILKITLLLILTFQLNVSSAQKIVFPNTIIVKDGLVTYDVMEDREAKITCGNFYVSAYVESVSQYKSYLKSLEEMGDEKALEIAQPNLEVWDSETFVASDLERSFFKEAYWKLEEFANYPAIGLTKQQISQYIKWKNLLLTEAILIYRQGDRLKFEINLASSVFRHKYPEEAIETFVFPDGNSYVKTLQVLKADKLEKPKGKKFLRWLNKNDIKYHSLIYDPTKSDQLIESSNYHLLLNDNGIYPVIATKINDFIGNDKSNQNSIEAVRSIPGAEYGNRKSFSEFQNEKVYSNYYVELKSGNQIQSVIKSSKKLTHLVTFRSFRKLHKKGYKIKKQTPF